MSGDAGVLARGKARGVSHGPGADREATALLVRTERRVGRGKRAPVLVIYTYDHAIVRDLLAIYAEIGRELSVPRIAATP